MRQLHPSARDAGHTDADLEGAVWSEKQSSEVCRAAAEALGKLGEHAAPAVPELTKYLAHEDRNVRRGGLCALERSQAVEQLRESQLKIRTLHATVVVPPPDLPVVRMWGSKWRCGRGTRARRCA